MSRQANDLTGRVFERLTARKLIRGKDGKLRWRCDCICGGVSDVRPAHLIDGTTKSCGCFREDMRPVFGQRRRLNLSGQRFGRLIVQTSAPDRGKEGATAWNCICDCGNKVVVRTLGLRHGKTVSCGCFAKEQLAKGLSTTHGLSKDPRWQMWRHAKERAERNSVPFTITFEDMPEIPKMCPVLPWIELKSNTGGKIITAASPTLDRVIPSLGYVPGNVHIVSNRANGLKSDASMEEARLIYEYMKEHITKGSADDLR